MRSGHPVDDADQLPWLQAVARWIDGQLAAHAPDHHLLQPQARLSDITIGKRRGVRLVYLKGEQGLIHGRIAVR